MGMARFRDGTGKWVRYFLLEFFPVFIGVCEYDFSFTIVLPHILQDCLNLAVPDMRMVATNCSAITDSNTDPSTFSRTGNYYLNNSTPFFVNNLFWMSCFQFIMTLGGFRSRTTVQGTYLPSTCHLIVFFATNKINTKSLKISF
jgi:hypothetical protein